jgi:hypothetical protein
MRDILQGKIHHILLQFLLLCYGITLMVGLPESSGERIRSFPVQISFHHGSPS